MTTEIAERTQGLLSELSLKHALWATPMSKYPDSERQLCVWESLQTFDRVWCVKRAASWVLGYTWVQELSLRSCVLRRSWRRPSAEVLNRESQWADGFVIHFFEGTENFKVHLFAVVPLWSGIRSYRCVVRVYTSLLRVRLLSDMQSCSFVDHCTRASQIRSAHRTFRNICFSARCGRVYFKA